MTWAPQHFPFLAAKYGDYVASMQPATRVLSGSLGVSAHQFDAELRALESGIYSWLDSDVSDLVDQTCADVPDWSPEAVMPTEAGVIAFEKPVHLPVTINGAEVAFPVDGFTWATADGRVFIHSIWKKFYPLLGDHYGRLFALGNEIAGAPRDFVSWPIVSFPVAAVDSNDFSTGQWLDCAEFERGAQSLVGYDASTDVLARPFLSMVGATWLLLAQPALVDAPPAEQVVANVKVPREKRRRSGSPKRQAVRVSVRTLTQEYRPHGRRRPRGKATTRWWVRGHWRQQAWGKNRSLRRPVYIAPHTAGARDGEIDDRPQIQVVRKD